MKCEGKLQAHQPDQPTSQPTMCVLKYEVEEVEHFLDVWSFFSRAHLIAMKSEPTAEIESITELKKKTHQNE